MTTQSDIEEAASSLIQLELKVDRLLSIDVPVVELRATGEELPEGALGATARYQPSDYSRDQIPSMPICLNNITASATSPFLVRILWSPSSGDSKAEIDVQIALDPDLFDEHLRRIPWTTDRKRKLPDDPTSNFYSSRLAGHTTEPIEISEEGLMFAVPREVAEALYFDFVCSPHQSDDDGIEPPLSVSPAEANLRAFNFYVRVFVKDDVSDVPVVLPSDLRELTQGRLLGFFAIRNAMITPAKTLRPAISHPTIDGAATETVADVEGVVIHVWANNFKNPAVAPTFYNVSAHYTISSIGYAWKYVEEDRRAGHTGHVSQTDPVTEWRTYETNYKYNTESKNWGLTKTTITPNDDMIGIEHEGTGDSPWELRKYVASAWLLQDIYTRWPRIKLTDRRILPHKHFAIHKTCPGQANLAFLIALARGYRSRLRVKGDPPRYDPVSGPQ